MENQGDQGDFFKEYATSQIFANLHHDVIFVTEDKLKLSLRDYKESIEKRSQWITPASLFITFIIVLSTAEFKNYCLKPETWEAIFVISTILSLGWLIYSLFRLGKKTNIENLISDIKATNKEKGDE